MERIGRYTLNNCLGKGGMGVVWRATDDQGRQVALKTVKLAHAKQLDGLRREIRVLSKLSHPGVVQIVDQGVHEGLPWYAMELLTGPSLRERARLMTSHTTTRLLLSNFAATSLGDTLILSLADDLSLDEHGELEPDQSPQTRPKAANGRLNEVLSLMLRMCAPIAFVHGEGVVHRDLKPENVLIVDGRPVIVDFGLVSSGVAGREVLNVDGMLRGTVSYMAPEQIRGELVDARADLYALGCMLYEVITGRLPFRSANVGATLYQHLQRSPLPPSERAEGVPPALDDLVMQLLEKRAQNRPGYAEDVAEVLRSLGAADHPEAGPTPRSYLYRPRFSGRREVLQDLESALDVTCGVIAIGGESGVGKTRLAMEFARLAASRSRLILPGDCQPADAESTSATGGALYPLRVPLQTVVDLCLEGTEAQEQILGDRGRLLARYQPDLLALPGIAESPEPDPLEPGAETRRVLEWLTQTLVAAGGESGTVVLIDDVQWADGLTLQWIEYVARVAPTGLLVVGTYRLDSAKGALQPLLRGDGLTNHVLRRLDRDAVSHMTSDMLAMPRLPLGLAEFLAEASDGNPFVVAEYLRAAVTRGMLTRKSMQWIVTGPGPSQDWSNLPLPQRLRDLVLARVARLSQLGRDTAELASVLGRDLDDDVIVRQILPGVDSDEAQWLDVVNELLDHHVLDADEHHGRLKFTHHMVREAVYEQIPADRRRTLHRTAAEALQSLLPSERDPAAIGHHWRRADAIDEARRWYQTAAFRALEKHNHADAERWLTEALDQAPLEVDTVRARVALGHRVLRTLGRNAEALDALESARNDAEALDDPALLASALLALGECTAEFGRLVDSLALYEHAAELLRGQGDPEGLGRALSLVARGLHLTGQKSRVAAVNTEALALARKNEDLALEARILMAIASNGDPSNPSASQQITRALELARELGNRSLEASALVRRATIQPTPEQELADYQQALSLWEKLGDRVRMGNMLVRCAAVEHRIGHTQRAHERYVQALKVFRQTGHHRFQGHTLHLIGRNLRQEGRLREGEALNRQALTLLRVVGDTRWMIRTRHELIRIMVRREMPEKALKMAEKAVDEAREIAQPLLEVRGLHLWIQACLGANQLQQADTHLEAARAVLEQTHHSELSAVTEVLQCRVDRLLNRDADRLEDRLNALIPHLPLVDESVARALAHVELAHLASTPETRRLRKADARDAHQQALFLDPLTALWLQELEPGDS